MGGFSIEVLRLDSLRKKYGAVSAVDGVSFCVRPGEVVRLLGPNGAGKTTMINMVMGVFVLGDAFKVCRAS
jgi:ABC-type multidrug transport system ATPase subunit